MRVFIIRPFKEKSGIDFDRVERDLIQPALKQLGRPEMQVSGSTTGIITKQGNIREDMFRLIAVSDLVIADISIQNDNVFYELGMRHALRPRHTFMIRSDSEHRHPFDLQTDRYFSYDAANPQASVAPLAQALRSSLASPEPDSPMFGLLPALVPHGRGQLVKVPANFREDVNRAWTTREYGKLRLFTHEAQGFEWDQEGVRLIGDAQFRLRAFFDARDTFELLRQTDGAHVHANLRLGTIYQRLGQRAPAAQKADLMVRSAQAIQRVIDASPAKSDLVEAHCLMASNEKSRWIDELADKSQAEQQNITLCSTHFDKMLAEYLLAANLDLNAHYPAINALAGLQIRRACAQALPEQWISLHKDEDSAARDLAAISKLIGHLVSTLHLALELDELMGKRPGEPDSWASGSRADFILMTECARTERVRQTYRKALMGGDWFALEAIRRNLDMYQALGLFEPGVSVALNEIDTAMAVGGQPPERVGKVLIFTGHMVDDASKPGAQPRFPNTPEALARARALIRSAVQAELAGSNGDVMGIAGGACGGDILFHEVCAELGVPTRLYLALPAARFEVASVQHGGPGWVERYRALLGRLTPHVLQPFETLPSWLTDKPGYNVWERNNLWTVFVAMSSGADDLSLLALYNCEREPVGPGGTAHLLEEAKKRGVKATELDARLLLAR
jgi:hypothetical protein